MDRVNLSVLHPALFVKVRKSGLPSIDRKTCGGIGRSGGAGTAPGPPSQGKRDNSDSGLYT